MSGITYTAPCPVCGVEACWESTVVAGPRVGHLDTVALDLHITCDCDVEVAS